MDSRLRPSEMLCWGTLGSVRPFPNFQPERDVVDLQAALEQKDINSLVRILTNRSSAQRQTLARDYQTHTQKELKAGLKKVLSGDLEALMLGLMMTPEQFEAHRLRLAMAGVGTDEETLLEILCMRTPQQLSDINAVYNAEYKRDLEKDLISETSGDFTKLLVALLKKEYRPGPLEPDVQVLSEELNSKKPTAGPWIQILTSRSPDHLRKAVCMCVRVCVSVCVRIPGRVSLPLSTVCCIENPHLYLAQRIQNMKGSVLQGVLVSHCEEDLLAVRVAFKTCTGTSLYTTLQVTHTHIHTHT
uniref:Annexin n=1 Tax=Pygocentrus nattereri TaxID=42514 RepID=A0A3B4D4E3_PYGNA